MATKFSSGRNIRILPFRFRSNSEMELSNTKTCMAEKHISKENGIKTLKSYITKYGGTMLEWLKCMKTLNRKMPVIIL